MNTLAKGRFSGNDSRCPHASRMIAAVLFASWAFTQAAVAQVQENPPANNAGEANDDNGSTPETDPATKQDSNKREKQKRGEWVLAPIPISNPALGAGLEWVVAYVFPVSRQDKISPNSVIGIGGLFTNNGTHGVAAGGRLYLKQDKYRFTGAGGNARINADVYGVGNAAGDRGSFVPLTATGSAFIAESLFRIRKGFYIGPRFQYRNLALSINDEKLTVPDIDNPPEGLTDVIAEVRQDLVQQRTVAIGPRFQWDTRDNPYYPRKGIFLDTGIDVFIEALGSKFTYQYYKAAFNKYTSVGQRQLIAFRGMGCAAAGEHVPIYDLCLFGSSNDLRGYPAGRYQDRRMFATQAEYRLTMPPKKFLGRFGIVGFGGFGAVGNTFASIKFGDLLPAGGGGVRFRLTKENPINFRVDYGIGKGGHTLTIGVAEAF